MTPAELLDLRRRTLEAMGWTYWACLTNPRAWIFLPPNEPEHSSIRATIGRYGMTKQETLAVEHLEGNTPALESDNGLALDALVKWCEEKHYRWHIEYDGKVFYALIVNRGSGNAETLAIAICEAICASAKKVVK